jgi:hypothetical protein
MLAGDLPERLPERILKAHAGQMASDPDAAFDDQ